MEPPRTFPIFPLPQVILVPGGLMPLHIFEPRYREMVADALDGDRLIGMALPLAPPVPREPDPMVHPVCGLGRLVQHDPMPDGRSNIVLEGIARMRIERELETDKPYRLVEGVHLPDVVVDDGGLPARTAALLARIPTLSERERTEAPLLPPGRQLDLALMRLAVPVPQKYDLFGIDDVARRLEAMERVVTWLERRSVRDEFEPGDPRLN